MELGSEAWVPPQQPGFWGLGSAQGRGRQLAVLVPGQPTSSSFWGGKNEAQRHLSP